MWGMHLIISSKSEVYVSSSSINQLCRLKARVHLVSSPSLSRISISQVEVCDFLNLAFFCLLLPESNAVMRYSAETCNRLMVHLAELINSYVKVVKALSSISKVVSTKQRPQITFGACITLQHPSPVAWPCCSVGHLHKAPLGLLVQVKHVWRFKMRFVSMRVKFFWP